MAQIFSLDRLNRNSPAILRVCGGEEGTHLTNEDQGAGGTLLRRLPDTALRSVRG